MTIPASDYFDIFFILSTVSSNLTPPKEESAAVKAKSSILPLLTALAESGSWEEAGEMSSKLKEVLPTPPPQVFWEGGGVKWFSLEQKKLQ